MLSCLNEVSKHYIYGDIANTAMKKSSLKDGANLATPCGKELYV